MDQCSLVPKPSPFLPSVSVRIHTWEQKTGEKWGRPGSIHQMSGHEDGGNEGPILKYVCTELANEFPTGQNEYFRSR